MITLLAVALTGFLLWAGLSWAFGLIFSALRLILITVAVGAAAILVLWLFGRGRHRR